MLAEDQFESWARDGLALAGIALDDVDLVVMKAIHRDWAPLQEALLAFDFGSVPPEANLDPSRPPLPVPQ
jgi:hypothetical protein